MSNELSALERDEQWLRDQGHSELDAEDFTLWVSRVMNDGDTEQGARYFVLGQMLKNTGDDTAKAGPHREGIY